MYVMTKLNGGKILGPSQAPGTLGALDTARNHI